MPIYQTKKDEKTENIVRKRLYDNGWKTSSTAITCAWDIEATKPKLFMAKKARALLIEVKRRKMSWGKFPTIFIDKSKVESIVSEAESRTDATVGIFVVVPDDGIPRFAWLTRDKMEKWGTNTTDVQAARNDPTDRGDVKYDIPLIDFHLMSAL